MLYSFHIDCVTTSTIERQIFTTKLLTRGRNWLPLPLFLVVKHK
uniref:GlycinetRNA ligase 2ic/mitochondrial isoform X3 n=1 Tax=Rhizophora mucronata TaxID=61149 RepID=A0A2P2LYC2_RHIMU